MKSRHFFLVSEQRANSDETDVTGHQVLENYQSFLNGDNVGRAVECIEVGKVEGGVGADNGDIVERWKLGVDTRRVRA